MAFFTPEQLRAYGIRGIGLGATAGPVVTAKVLTKTGKTVTASVPKKVGKVVPPAHARAVKNGPLAQRVEKSKKSLKKGMADFVMLTPRPIQGLVPLQTATGGVSGLVSGLAGSSSRAMYAQAWNQAKGIVADGIAKGQPALDKLDGINYGLDDQIAALQSMPVLQDPSAVAAAQAFRTVQSAKAEFVDKLEALRTVIDDMNTKATMVEQAEAGGGSTGPNSPAQQALHAAKLAAQSLDAMIKSVGSVANRLSSSVNSATVTINQQNQALLDKAAQMEAEAEAQRQAQILVQQEAQLKADQEAARAAAEAAAMQQAQAQIEAERNRQILAEQARADAQAAQAAALEQQKMQMEMQRQQMELQLQLAQAQAQASAAQAQAQAPTIYGGTPPTYPIPIDPRYQQVPGSVPVGFGPQPTYPGSAYDQQPTPSAFGPSWSEMPVGPSFEAEGVVAVQSPMTPPNAYQDPYAQQGGSGYGSPSRPSTDYAPEMFGMGVLSVPTVSAAMIDAAKAKLNDNVKKYLDTESRKRAEAEEAARAAEEAARKAAAAAQGSWGGTALKALGAAGAVFVAFRVGKKYLKTEQRAANGRRRRRAGR